MPTRKRLAASPSKPAAAPVASVKPHPLARAEALRLAGGDRSRLLTLPDGSVLVTRPSAK